MSTVAEISEAIEKLSIHEQIELLGNIGPRLKVSPEEFGWAKAAEKAFAFWDNPDDAIYDKL